MDTLKQLIKMSIWRYFLLIKAKKKYKKYAELWSKIRDLIRSIIKNSDDCDEKYMKIKFNSDEDLPLNKMIEIPSMIIVVTAVFNENNKYYAQVFLYDVCINYRRKCRRRS